APPAEPDPGAAELRARGRAVSVAAAQEGRRPGAVPRGHGPDRGDPQPDARGQGPPDLLADAGRPGRARHADLQPVAGRAGADRSSRSRPRAVALEPAAGADVDAPAGQGPVSHPAQVEGILTDASVDLG